MRMILTATRKDGSRLHLLNRDKDYFEWVICWNYNAINNSWDWGTYCDSLKEALTAFNKKCDEHNFDEIYEGYRNEGYEMNNYSTYELKQGYKALYNTECNQLWSDINTELVKRLGKDEYINFSKTYQNDVKMNIGKLKPYIDNTIGQHGHITIYNGVKRFLCQGIVKELRQNELWNLLDEENTEVAQSYLGTSEYGEESTIIIILHQYPNN